MSQGQLICDGNSLTAASYGPYTPWPAMVEELTGHRLQVMNLAVGGQTTQQMAADFASQVAPLYSADRACNIYAAWEIRNDLLYNALTPAQAVANYWALLDAAQAAGFTVVAFTMVPSRGVSVADIASVNALVRAGWASHADALCDVAADARMAGNVWQQAIASPAVELHAAKAQRGSEPGSNAPLTTQFYDASGNGRHGTLTNFAGTTASGYAGTGTLADPHRLVFDPTAPGDYVALPDLSAAEDKAFTYEVWFRTSVGAHTGTGSYGQLVGEGLASSYTPFSMLCVWNSTVRYWMRDDAAANGIATGVGAVNDGALHQAYVVCNGSTAQVYIDNVASGAAANLPAGSETLDTGGLGSRVRFVADYPLDGSIILARIYPFALTPEQVAQNFAAGPLWEPSDVFISDDTHLTNSGQAVVAEAAAATLSALIPDTAPVLVPTRPVSDASEESVAVLLGTGSAQVDLVAEGLVDPETVQDSDCEHGFESAEFEVEGRPHIRAHNALVDGAAVKVVRGGKTTFEGQVAVISDAVSPQLVECAGVYDRLSRDEAYCEGFVESRCEMVQEYTPTMLSSLGTKVLPSMDMNTDGQIHFIVPKGSKIKTGQGRGAYLSILGGLVDGFRIARVTGTLACAGASEIEANISVVTVSPFDPGFIGSVTSVVSVAGDSGTFDIDLPEDVEAPTETAWTAVDFTCYALADVTETSGENSIQLRDLTIYIDRTTAPRPDQIIAEIACPADDSICLASSTESLGSAVTQFMVDPFTTRSEAIEQARALYSGIMDVGVWDDATVHVRARPTSPPDRSHWIALSLADLANPAADWGIVKDTEAGIDAICCLYSVLGHATKPNGTPCSVYYPSKPANADARVAVLELGDATDAEAAAAAEQVYLYQSQLAAGSVPLDEDHLVDRYGVAAVPTVDGALLPLSHIRSWDWVMCVDATDPESRGPFMLSRVERTGEGVSIEVGGDYWQHPGYLHAERKGRYRRGHWRTTRRKEWRKTKPTKASGKGWHRKGQRWWRYKKVWVEGRYI